MDDQEWLAERFEEHRTHLRAVAYRMLGSLTEADDAVQEAWIRLSRSDAEEIENLGGGLATGVARVSPNMLRSRKSRRGAARVCAARHVRRAVRGDRLDRRALANGSAAARQPGPAPRAGRGAGAEP